MAYVNSLEDIQSLIGNIETCPSEIINHIFKAKYNRKNIFRVILFIYGNCVPVGLALCFYTKCNNHSNFLAVCQFTVLYNLWYMHLNSECTRKFCAYYEMHLKRRVWVNRDLREREGNPPIPLGIENTGNAAYIPSNLNGVFGYVSG